MKGWSLILYGTTQPIQKNDPISVPINPPDFENLPSQLTPNALPKSPNGKTNRKQQQQQQFQQLKASNSSSSAVIIVTSPRKNGSKNNQKNQTGKNGKQRVTTARPLTTLYFNKDRKYEFINGIMSVNKPTTSPSASQRPNKVLNNNDVDSKNEKFVYLKAPIKAPKQVKENSDTIKMTTKFTIVSAGATTTKSSSLSYAMQTTAMPSLPHIDLLDSIQFTSNPNIPKLFQQYEKIQKFYPELQPYENVSKQPTRSPFGGGKPSRDGSRGNYFQINEQPYNSPSSLLSLSPSSASGSSASKVLSTALLGTATKKSSLSSLQQLKTQSSTIIASKNGNG